MGHGAEEGSIVCPGMGEWAEEAGDGRARCPWNICVGAELRNGSSCASLIGTLGF